MARDANSEFRIAQATASYTSLNDVVNGLTIDEVVAALKLETATRRRKSIVGRLLQRYARLVAQREVAALKKELRIGTRGPTHERAAQKTAAKGK